jgi:transcriptional repressor NrdR
MKCPQCSHESTKVLESRESKDGKIMRRRRECPNCNYRFTTFEKADETIPYVEKKDGTREPFSRDKLLRSMLIACRKRNVSVKELEGIVDWMEKTAMTSEGGVITTSRMGELVLNVLYHLDTVAYVRFASVYRAFENVDDFFTELKNIKSDT